MGKWIFVLGCQFVEAERGKFEATLYTNEGEEIAHTEGEKVIAYNKAWKAHVKEWAEYYDITDIEWRA